MTKLVETVKSLSIGQNAKTIANEKMAEAVKAHEAASEAFLDKVIVLHDAYACDANTPDEKMTNVLLSCASFSKESGPSTFMSLTLPVSVAAPGGGGEDCSIEWTSLGTWQQVMGVIVDQRKVFVHDQMSKISDHDCFDGMKKIWENLLQSDARKPYTIKKVSVDVRKEIGNVPSGLPIQLFDSGKNLQDLSVSLKHCFVYYIFL